MNLIVAVDASWGIGKNGKLLANIPEDMKFFKKITMGKTLLFGRKTMESFPGGKALKGRRNIVLSKAMKSSSDYEVCTSIKEALSLLDSVDSDEIFVIGGQSVYEQLLPYCRLAYVTKIDKTFKADCRFPNLDQMENWVPEMLSEPKHQDDLSFQFWCYRNTKVKK